jgi:alpha-D-ribose 1-methylphosphonate 5-phosphate C-P lyase
MDDTPKGWKGKAKKVAGWGTGGVSFVAVIMHVNAAIKDERKERLDAEVVQQAQHAEQIRTLSGSFASAIQGVETRHQAQMAAIQKTLRISSTKMGRMEGKIDLLLRARMTPGQGLEFDLGQASRRRQKQTESDG